MNIKSFCSTSFECFTVYETSWYTVIYTFRIIGALRVPNNPKEEEMRLP